MCLSIPARIVSIEGNMAKVSAGGALFDAGLQMIENPVVGDYILLHAGFAIQKIRAISKDSRFQCTVDRYDRIVKDIMTAQAHTIRHAPPLILITQTSSGHSMYLGHRRRNEHIYLV